MVKSGVDKSVDNFLTGQKVSCQALTAGQAPTARQRRGVSGGGCAGNKLGKDVNAAAAVPEDERYLPASPDLVRLDAGTNVGGAFYRLSALERVALGFDDEAAYKQRKLSVLEQYFLLGVLDDEKVVIPLMIV